MTRPNVHPFGILIIPFDIVFNALVESNSNRERSLQQIMFYRCGPILGCKGSSDMIFSAFDLNCMTKTQGYLPGLKNKSKKTLSNHSKIQKIRPRVSGGPATP